MFFPEGTRYQTKENRERLATRQGMEQVMATGEIAEAIAVMCDSQHALWVQLPWGRGVIPREEGALGIDTGDVRDIALIARVGRPVCFTVTRITADRQGEPLAILSRRAAQKQCREEYLDRLTPGDVIDARVTHLAPFGAFCDVGCGISSLIPIDNISVSRITHPAHRFFVGQTIKAVVKGLLPDGKINLSHKELLGTWEENANLFRPGETVSGIVRTVEPYGSFVELTPNLAGLAEPKEGVAPGQRAAVFIKALIPEKMKVKLVIVDSFTQDIPPAPLDYFTHATHLDHWQYSPAGCAKTIATDFSL